MKVTQKDQVLDYMRTRGAVSIAPIFFVRLTRD